MVDTPSHAEHLSLSPSHSYVDGPSLALLRKIAQHARALLNAQECTVGLLDEARTNVWLVTDGNEPDNAAQTQLPLPALVGKVVEQRKPAILRHTRLNALMQPLAVDTTCDLACLPLLDQGQLLGVLCASTPETFTPQEINLLSLLAEQATLTLRNARQTRLVEEARRMKANFLSLITHELRSPLNAINGYLDLTLEGLAGPLNEQQQEFLQRARAGSEHLYALVEDLLLAARADAGQLRLTRELIHLPDLVNDALAELELTARDAEVSLCAHVPEDLPALVIDAVRVQQVLRNLLNNALQSTPKGGAVTISARYEAAENLVQIQVTDSGCGIAPEYHERIFERFFQVPRPTGGRSTGMGLGLAIVKMIVELHGGQVGVESAIGQGSTFFLTLKSL